MKVVILAGGYGTRISEESQYRPKPMVEVGGSPILWHIMKIYSSFGYHDFIICLGYKGYYIKDYFEHYLLHSSDVTYDFASATPRSIHSPKAEPWRVTLVDTGLETQTGGRLRRVREYLGDETFMLTYGDGVSTVDIHALVDYHQSHGKAVTVTAALPKARFGALDMDEVGQVFEFKEKPQGMDGWVSAGFFVMNTEIFDFLQSDDTLLEQEPLAALARAGELMAYRHSGFWQPMDTLRDKQYLDELWATGRAEWKRWNP